MVALNYIYYNYNQFFNLSFQL